MKDIIDILRQQLILCRRLLELAQAQKIELVKTDAVAARKLTSEIEPVMADINSLEKRKEELLTDLKAVNSANMQYLDRHTKFIDYNINVMTQTSAGVTYGTPGDDGGMPVQGRKMFEAGV